MTTSQSMEAAAGDDLSMVMTSDGRVKLWSRDTRQETCLAVEDLILLLLAGLRAVDGRGPAGVIADHLARQPGSERGRAGADGRVPDDRPIFVLGTPRSGTTLLRQILDSHPRIACGPESVILQAFREVARAGRLADYAVRAGVQEAQLLEVLRGVFGVWQLRHAVRSGKRRWADKSPAYASHPDFLHDVFGAEASYVVIVRHGLDVAASMVEMVASGAWDRTMGNFNQFVQTTDSAFEQAARIWAFLSDKLHRFSRRQGREVHVIKYEDLVTTPGPVIAGLFTFLNEPTPADFVAHVFDRPLPAHHDRGHGDDKLRSTRRFEPGSIGRWRQLPPGLVDSVRDIVAGQLRSWDYAL
jgi:protein-tyrosine sulfotransferase